MEKVSQAKVKKVERQHRKLVYKQCKAIEKFIEASREVAEFENKHRVSKGYPAWQMGLRPRALRGGMHPFARWMRRAIAYYDLNIE